MCKPAWNLSHSAWRTAWMRDEGPVLLPFYPLELQRTTSKHQNMSSAFRTSSSSLIHRTKTSFIVIGNKSFSVPADKGLDGFQLWIEPLRLNKQDRGLTPEEPQMWSSCFDPRAVSACYYCTRGNSLHSGVNVTRGEERENEIQRGEKGGRTGVGMKWM